MPRSAIEDWQLEQMMERAWLFMALIGCALSDHPCAKLDQANRRCVDRARKALFDLYKNLEAEWERRARSRETAVRSNKSKAKRIVQDEFGERLLRLKGTVPQSANLEFEDKPKRPSMRKRPPQRMR